MEVDRSDAEPVSGPKHGIAETLAIQSRVGRKAPDNGGCRAADDQAVKRLDSPGDDPVGTGMAGPYGAFGGAERDDLALARPAADLEQQRPLPSI